jgi:SRSO17 transposase
MTSKQFRSLGPALIAYLDIFRTCFPRLPTFEHLKTYCRGLLSDLARKSVEPIALASGAAVRTLQEFLTHHVWNHDGVLARLQRRIVNEHLPAPGAAPGTGEGGELGVIGLIDETSVAKKGDKTPGVQRQYCGSRGKLENCIVSVHLAVQYGSLLAMLDSDLFLPEKSWDQNRARCKEAHIPDHVMYRPKWVIALEQIKRAIGNGVRFDWLVFDEGYGGKPEFLYRLEELGMNYVCEVPANFMCWATFPRYHSLQRPFVAKRVDAAARYGRPFQSQKWQTVNLSRQTLAPQTWKIKAAQVYLPRDGKPADRTQGGQVLHQQCSAADLTDYIAEGGVQPLARRACIPGGQD